jgi:excisionase family DNA binding protein
LGVHRATAGAAVRQTPAIQMTFYGLVELAGTNTEVTAMDEPRLTLTVTEAAKLLRLSRAFTYELVARGELPSVRLGRRIVIPRVAIERILNDSVDALRPPA